MNEAAINRVLDLVDGMDDEDVEALLDRLERLAAEAAGSPSEIGQTNPEPQ